MTVDHFLDGFARLNRQVYTAGAILRRFLGMTPWRRTALGCSIFLGFNLTSNTTATLPVYMARFREQQGMFVAQLSASSTIAILPAIVVGWMTQKSLVKGLTQGAVNYTDFPARFLWFGQGYLWGVVPTQLPLFAVLGLLCGALAVVITKGLFFVESIYRLTRSSAGGFGTSNHSSPTVASGVILSLVLPISSLLATCGLAALLSISNLSTVRRTPVRSLNGGGTVTSTFADDCANDSLSETRFAHWYGLAATSAAVRKRPKPTRKTRKPRLRRSHERMGASGRQRKAAAVSHIGAADCDGGRFVGLAFEHSRQRRLASPADPRFARRAGLGKLQSHRRTRRV